MPPLPKVGCPKCLEIQNPWGKVLERSGLRIEHLFGLGFDIGCLDEGHTDAAMVVMWWLQKIYFQILKSVTSLGFFNIEEFYQG